MMQVTRKTMTMKSNHKEVPEHGTMGKMMMAPTGAHAKSMSMMMENEKHMAGKVGMPEKK